MEYKLEITKKLEDITSTLTKRIAILNLPTDDLCGKRSEKILLGERPVQACMDCITQKSTPTKPLSIEKIKSIIDDFSKNYGTLFMTINGKGDPFYPKLKDETLEKIRYAHEKHGIRSYVFTAGDNLDKKTCDFLAEHEVNVMISLYGNQFVDADFFKGKEYTKELTQDRPRIAENLRRLIKTYKESSIKPEAGTTRLGMNYVVTHTAMDGSILWSDIVDEGKKVKALKEAANENGIFFVVNTPFIPNNNPTIQKQLEAMAYQFSDFHLRHSTVVSGECQMGAGSGATVDRDGMLLRCPYMDNSQGGGIYFDLSPEKRDEIINQFMADRKYICVMRKHEKRAETKNQEVEK